MEQICVSVLWLSVVMENSKSRSQSTDSPRSKSKRMVRNYLTFVWNVSRHLSSRIYTTSTTSWMELEFPWDLPWVASRPKLLNYSHFYMGGDSSPTLLRKHFEFARSIDFSSSQSPLLVRNGLIMVFLSVGPKASVHPTQKVTMLQLCSASLWRNM